MAKILLVEDDLMLSKMYANKLLKENYEVVVAYDGSDGYKKALEENPSLIILDLMMPKTDGIECLRLLKKDDQTKKIPVAILTVFQPDSFDKDDQELFKEASVYWRKDQMSPAEIANQIKELLK